MNHFFRKINYKNYGSNPAKKCIAMQSLASHTVLLNVHKLINKHVKDQGLTAHPC